MPKKKQGKGGGTERMDRGRDERNERDERGLAGSDRRESVQSDYDTRQSNAASQDWTVGEDQQRSGTSDYASQQGVFGERGQGQGQRQGGGGRGGGATQASDVDDIDRADFVTYTEDATTRTGKT